MKALIIEDDQSVARSIAQMLASENITSTVETTGEDGAFMARHDDFDIILLDLGLPDTSGFEVLKGLRSARVKTPVMILSGERAVEDRVRGIATGADDYLTKPFHKDELIVRMHAIIRRSAGAAQSVIEIDGLTIDIGGRRVEAHGQAIDLTRSEYEILEILALRRGKVVTREMLLDQLYQGRDEPEPKIVDVFMSKLRKKLSQALWPDATRAEQQRRIGTLIATSWGRGYQLRPGE
jgi:two-component system cell cycle response regulator CtrA